MIFSTLLLFTINKPTAKDIDIEKNVAIDILRNENSKDFNNNPLLVIAIILFTTSTGLGINNGGRK